ncbi:MULTISPECIES: MarR family transcriptional regulator [Actinosynnema]|uniref:MarR family winged helix-turn-helix transcriptional regulator n=1 Tax=Actinosynnema TaxID=40566 RepID=UPI0020A3540C|nr:MarR family transcriptional regulator [Actinosynnema pretiosum]
MDTQGVESAFAGYLAMALVEAGRSARRRIEDELADYGLTLRYLDALGHLARGAELSGSDLARRMGITAQSAHATILRLEDLGAVERSRTGRGRRSLLDVTGAGGEMLTAADRVLNSLDARLLDAVPDVRDGEVRRLVAVLETDAARETGAAREEGGTG